MAITFNHNDQVYVKDGKMGIGASDPLRKLHVVGDFSVNASTSQYYGILINGGESSNPAITIGDWHNSSATIKWDSTNNYLVIDSQHSSSGSAILFTGNDSATEYMRITGTGNVGIGTTSPTEKFEISSGSASNLVGKISQTNTAYQAWWQAQSQDGKYINIGVSNNADNYAYINTSKNTLRFLMNSSVKMAITSGGNIGIGTTGPASKLHLEIPTSSNGTRQEIQRWVNAGQNSASLFAYGGSVDLIQIGAWNAEQNIAIVTEALSSITATTAKGIYIKSGGNVGIGTTSPAQKLHIFGGNASIDNSTDVSLIFAKSGVSKYEWYLDNAANNFGLYDRGNSAWRLNVNNTGNVGIGTTSPNAKLEVNGAITFSSVDTFGQLVVKAASGATGDMLNIGVDTANSIAFIQAVERGVNVIPLSLQRYGGNVGIGTASPSQKLDVAGSVIINDTSDPTLYMRRNDGTPVSAIMLDTSTDNIIIGATNMDELIFRDDSGEAMRIDGSGNVGIGTTSPASKLEVAGNIKLSGYIVDSNSEIIDFAVNDLKVQGKHINAEFGVWARSYGTVRQMGIDGGAAYMGLYTSGTEKVRIDTSGNVGIGTTGPIRKLDVNSAAVSDIARFGNNSGNFTFGQTTALTSLDLTASNAYRIRQGSTTPFYIKSDGNVGIGTTSPSSKLHVNYEDAESVLTISRGGTNLSAGTAIGTIQFNADYQGSPISYGSIDMYANSLSGVRSSLDFNVKSTSGGIQTGLTVQGNSGTPRVGIGTTSPGAKLDITTDHTSQIPIRVTHNNYNDWLIQKRRSDDTQKLGIKEVNSNGGMGFATADAVRMVIDSSGNVGIGTTSPSRQLELRGQGVIRLNAISGGDPGLDFNTSDVNDMQIRYRSTTDALAIYSYGTSSDVLTIRKSDGNVGIGTTSPAYTLDVAGGVFSSSHFTTDNNQLLSIYQSGWTGNENHYVLYNAWTSGTGDYLLVKSSGNQAGTNGTVLIGDGSGGRTFFGRHGNRSTAIDSSTAPLDETYAYIGATGTYFGSDVGIGTTSPAEKLNIYTATGRNFKVNQSTANVTILENDYELELRSGGGYDLKLNANGSSAYGNVTFRTDGSERMRITSAGNVGIGTTAPQAGKRLDVRSDGSIAGSNAIAGYGYNDSGTAILGNGYATSGTGTNYGIIGISTGTRTGGTNVGGHFYASGAGTNYALTTGSGNVGIGTNSPSYNLDVNGNINATGFYIGEINQISGTEYIAPLARTGTWTRDAGTSSSDEWVKVISYNGGPRRIRLWLNHGGDNTNMYDEYLISHSSYGMQTHIYRLPGSKYNTSKVLGIKVINSSGAVQDVWVKLAGIASGSGSFVYRSNVIVESSTNVAASATATEPSGTTGSSVLYISDSNRNEFTTMSSGGGYFGGNISIGTASPTANLHITSGGTPIKMSRSGYDDYGFMQSAGTGLQIQNFTDNRTEMFFDGGGNVGIGTTSPGYKLEVEGAISAGTANSTSGSLILVGKYSNGNIITIGGGYSAGGAVIGYGVKPSTTAAGAFLSSSALTNLERSAYVQHGSTHQWWTGAYQTAAVDSAATLSQVMTLDGSGNLGIGTTTPTAPLHIEGGTTSEVIKVEADANPYVRFVQNGTNVGFLQFSGGSAYLSNQSAGSLLFRTNNTDKMVITSAGNVGIGTTSPGYKLTVDNDDLNTNNPALYVKNPNSSTAAVIAEFVGDSDSIQIKNIGTGDYAIYNTQQSNGIALYDGAGGVEIHYNGSTVLEADSTGGVKVTGQLSATGDVVAYSSDERLKENIKPIENAVDKIKQLKGVTFDWNEKSQELGFEPSTKTNDVGVIAQDVEAVFPQLVHLAPFDIGSDEEGKATSRTGEDYKTVNYARLTAVLIEAVKEQQKQIDELKEIINGFTK